MNRQVITCCRWQIAVLAAIAFVLWTGLGQSPQLLADEGQPPSRVPINDRRSSDIRSLASLLPLITDEAVAGAVVYPHQFFNSDVARSLPVEIVTIDLAKYVGFDVRAIEFAVAFLERGKTQVMSTGLIIRFNQAADWWQIPHSVLRETVFGQLDGRPYRKGKGPLDFSLLLLDTKTLILAPDLTLKRMLAKREAAPSDQSISHQLSQGIGKSLDVHIAVNASSFRPLVALQLNQLNGDAEVWQRFAQLLDEVERFELRARLSRQLAIGLVAEPAEGVDGARLQTVWDAWSAALQSRLAQGATESASVDGDTDTVPLVLRDERTLGRSQQVAEYVRRAISEQLSRRTAKVAGNRLQWGIRGNTSDQVVACAAMTMLMGPAIETISAAVDRWQSMDGMQRLSEAMLAHAHDRRHYPARASFGEDDQPLLSWRVHLLPFLGHKSLYREFHLDEPWDSQHNLKLIRRMPAVYQNPRRSCDYRTTFMVPVGAGTMFEGTVGMPRQEIGDGAENTLMMVEADDDHAVYWTKPGDLSYDERNPWSGLGRLRKAGFMGASADGAVRFHLRSLDQFKLRAFFSRDGGETQLH